MLGFVCILLAIETLFCIAQARTIELMYIDNRNYPGGPWQYFLDTQYLPIDIMFCSSLFCVTLVCDLLMVCTWNPLRIRPLTLRNSSGDAGSSGQQRDPP